MRQTTSFVAREMDAAAATARDMYSGDCFSVSNFFSFVLIAANTAANVMVNLNNNDNNNNNNNNRNNNNNINQNNFNEEVVNNGGRSAAAGRQTGFWAAIGSANDAVLRRITSIVEENPGKSLIAV